MGQCWKADARTQVGEEAEVFAERQQCATLRLDLRWQALPLWPTHGPEQDGIGFFRSGDGFRWKRVTCAIDRCATDEMFGAGNREAELGFHGVQKADGLGHDFRANAVSGEDRDTMSA